MKKIVVLLLVLGLLILSGCGGEKEVEKTDSFTDEQGVLQTDEIGSQTATYEGDKYIVSDGINNDSQSGVYDSFHELCLIKTPEEWESIDEEIWRRNDLQYVGVATTYGTKSFQYMYLNPLNIRDVFTISDGSLIANNELPVEDPVEEYLNKVVHDRQDDYDSSNEYRDSDDQISMEKTEIKTTRIGEQDVSYLICNIHDGHDIVIVHSAFQKADDCIFCVSVAYDILKEGDSEIDEIQLLHEAYSNISFYDSDFDTIEASSPDSKPTIVSGDNKYRCVIDDSSSENYYYNRYSTNVLNSDDGDWSIDFNTNPDGTTFQTRLNFVPSDEEYVSYDIVERPEIKEYDIDGYHIKATMLRYDEKFHELGENPSGRAEMNAWFQVGENCFSIEYSYFSDESIRDVSIDTESILKNVLKKLHFEENASNYKNKVKNKNAAGAVSGDYDMEEIQAMISKVWIGGIEEDGEMYVVSYFQNEDASICGYLEEQNGSIISMDMCVGETSMSDYPMVIKEDGRTVTAKEVNITSENGKTNTYYTYEEDGVLYISFEEGDEHLFVGLIPSTTDEFMSRFEHAADAYDTLRLDHNSTQLN